MRDPPRPPTLDYPRPGLPNGTDAGRRERRDDLIVAAICCLLGALMFLLGVFCLANTFVSRSPYASASAGVAFTAAGLTAIGVGRKIIRQTPE